MLLFIVASLRASPRLGAFWRMSFMKNLIIQKINLNFLKGQISKHLKTLETSHGEKPHLLHGKGKERSTHLLPLPYPSGHNRKSVARVQQAPARDIVHLECFDKIKIFFVTLYYESLRLKTKQPCLNQKMALSPNLSIDFPRVQVV